MFQLIYGIGLFTSDSERQTERSAYTQLKHSNIGYRVCFECRSDGGVMMDDMSSRVTGCW